MTPGCAREPSRSEASQILLWVAMSTARLAFLCIVIVMLIFFLSALMTGVVVLAVLAGLLALLKDHRKHFFDLSQKGLFTYVAYSFAVVVMVWTTVSFIPGIERLIPSGWLLPDPFIAGYWLHFTLGSLFLAWALKPTNPDAQPMSFTGGVFWEQVSLLKQTPRMIMESLRRAAISITQDHWLKGLAGVVLLVLSIPVSVIALTAGVLAMYWFALLWAGMGALLVIPLWLAFKVIHRKGFTTVCTSCGRVHPISGPGPMGILQVQCRCGQKIGIWKRKGEVIPADAETSPLPWLKRPTQAGTIPLLILGVGATLLMASRTFGLWNGPPRKVPWAGSSHREETHLETSDSSQSVPVRPSPRGRHHR